MLGDASTITVLPVRALERAKSFYAGPLGLRELGARPGGQFHFALGSGGTLALFEKPASLPSETTALSFAVEDIHTAIAALKGRGVVFEDYDFPGFKTEGHVADLGTERAAWFKDPEGNILCVHQDLTPAS